jgi:hypothetical protein
MAMVAKELPPLSGSFKLPHIYIHFQKKFKAICWGSFKLPTFIFILSYFLFLHLIFALILVVFINFKQVENFNMKPPSNILQWMNEFVELSCLVVAPSRPPNALFLMGGMLFHEWVSVSGEHEWWTRFYEQEGMFSINFIHVRKYIL